MTTPSKAIIGLGILGTIIALNSGTPSQEPQPTLIVVPSIQAQATGTSEPTPTVTSTSKAAVQATNSPKPASTPKSTPVATPRPIAAPACHPSYSGCLDPDASDYDCAGGSGNGPKYTGRVQVIGPDVFDLDSDSDGIGCE